MRASLLLPVEDGAARLGALLDAVVEAGVAEDVEVVIATSSTDPATASLVAACGGDVVVVAQPPGTPRAALLASAAARASATIVVVPAPEARPLPGALDALVDAVAAGAPVAAAAVITAAGRSEGFALAADGSLVPVRDVADAALPHLDLVAVPRDRIAAWDVPRPREGLPEALLGRSLAAGGFAVPADAGCRRGSVGPRLTVAICSRDRAAEVEGGVEGLLAHGFGPDDGEILLVDNGSRASEAARLAALASAFPAVVRVVAEPSPGLSRARNAAWRAARHEVVAYLDDDSRVAPRWAEAVRDAFADPGVAIVGGPIIGLFPEGAPSAERLPDERLGYLSLLERGGADHAMPPSDGPWGANYAVRRAAIATVGGFDPDLGWQPGSRLGGEEVVAATAIVAAGLGRVCYAVGAVVGHRVPSTRLSDEALAARAFASGVGLVHVGPRVGAIPAAALPTILARGAARLAHVGALAPGDSDASSILRRLLLLPLPAGVRLDACEAVGALVAAASLAGQATLDLPLGRLVVDRDAAAGIVDVAA